MKDIWKLSHDLNIYDCCHIYRKTNRTLAKKVLVLYILVDGGQIVQKMLLILVTRIIVVLISIISLKFLFCSLPSNKKKKVNAPYSLCRLKWLYQQNVYSLIKDTHSIYDIISNS